MNLRNTLLLALLAVCGAANAVKVSELPTGQKVGNILDETLLVGGGATTAATPTVTIPRTDAGTNVVAYLLRLQRESSGTPAAGIGTGIEFRAETAAGNVETGATIEAVTTDVTSTSEDFDLVFKTMAAGGAAAAKARVTSTGEIVSYANTNTDWFSGDYAGSKYVRIGLGSAGYGLFSGSVYGADSVNGFAVGTEPAIYARAAWTVGTASAAFLTGNNGSNTTASLTINSVGLTTKPALRIDQTAATTALPLDVRLNSATVFRIGPNGNAAFSATNTAAATTGAQTIDKPSGTVNFAAAASTLVVTNSLVTTASIVFAVVRTADTTAEIKSVVPAAGSFTITLSAAATAETSVGFLVIN